MTADRTVCIPGLDHSLVREDGLLLWVQTPDYRPPTRMTNADRRKIKANARRVDRPDTGQTVFWESMA